MECCAGIGSNLSKITSKMKSKSKSVESISMSTAQTGATESPGSSRTINEIYLENNRLRERLGLQPNTEGDLPLEDRLSQIRQDNVAIKLKLRKDKRQRWWMFLLVSFIAVVLVVGLAVVITLQSNKPTLREDDQGMAASLLQPLPIGHPQTAGGDNKFPSSLMKYYFNVGMRNDYQLQECQGPQLKRSFPDMDYALLGYNVLKGYPLAVGHDPGFTLPIFSADYRAGGQTADCRYSTPKGIILIPDVSCITSFSSEVVETKYAFSKSLAASASVSGGGWGVSFSGSAGYKTSSSEISTGQSVFILSKASCNYYYMRLLEDDAPPFHPVFMKWILKLNKSDKDADYFEFFDKYGTHYLSEVKFGASFTYEHKMSSKKYETAKSKQVNVAAQASYSGVFSLSGGFSMDDSQREEASDFQKSVTTRTITIGAAPPSNGDAMTWASTVKESPVPVSYTLESIDGLFSDTFMNTESTRRYKIDHKRIAKRIASLRRNYCELLKNRGLLDNCAELQPGITMATTMLNGGSPDKTRVSSTGKCIEECVKRDACVAISFCSKCTKDHFLYNICFMYRESYPKPVDAFTRYNAETTIFIPALKKQFVLRHTAVNGIERTQGENVTEANDTRQCFAQCLSDLYCVAFTFCACPDQVKKCTLYSESKGNLRLISKTFTDTHFISRHVKDVEEVYPTTTSSTLPSIA